MRLTKRMAKLHEIINNTADRDWYQEYIDYDKLDKLI